MTAPSILIKQRGTSLYDSNYHELLQIPLCTTSTTMTTSIASRAVDPKSQSVSELENKGGKRNNRSQLIGGFVDITIPTIQADFRIVDYIIEIEWGVTYRSGQLLCANLICMIFDF
ncbi:hypothetical protein ACOME3_008213 [Neoechinorhynchus agilis]